MPSVQRYLSGRHNLARTAALSASSVRASTAIDRVSAVRAGGGRVRADGDYTGHEATLLDVEIVAAGGTPRSSVPQFAGVGNGSLAVTAVDSGAAQQTFTLTLADLGVPTATAGLDVRDVRLRAKATGAAGNNVRINVQPLLARTATAWALLTDWPTSQTLQTGPQWDFGGLPLSSDGAVDSSSPRLQFGFDPQVYRPYRTFKDGEWRFGLSPDLQRSVTSGTKVYAITGRYLVTVTDGTTTETFGDTGALQPAIVTFYDLLQALAASTLVDVAGVVAAERRPGGQAAIDVPLRTQAWLLALSGRIKLESISVPATAPTQTLLVRCINADVVGQERWSVSADVSGSLPTATTGIPYISAAALFTVPPIAPPVESTGRWSFKFNPMPRLDTQGLPSLCVRPFRMGINARPLTVTFRYARRPPADCKCSDMPTPKISDRCLGIGDDSMTLDPAHASRLQALFEWRRDFVESNTDVGPPPNYSSADMDFADAVTGAFAQALAETYEEVAALAEWDLAVTAMEADMAALDAMGTYATWPRSSEIQNNLSTLYANPVTGKLYRCIVQMTDVLWDVKLSDESFQRWANPAATEWDVAVTTPFTVPSDNNPMITATYQYIGAETDLRAGGDADAQTRAQLLRRYAARMDYVRTLAGIVPKSESSSSDAGGCWIDHGDAYWWVDTDGYYLPAFTNQAYISARRDTETGKAYSTKEFGFGLVVACPDRLLVGDEVTIRIEQVDTERPYRVGDEAVVQTVGAAPAWLSGGVDGTDVQTWRVAASAAGALASYMVPTDGSAVPSYTAAGVTLQLAPGGIPFELGDSFSFAVEAGQYRWRRDGGAWSTPADIPASGPATLADGLQLQFEPGAAPSFVAADAYTFDVRQPHAASHVQDAGATVWAWAGATANTVIDFGAVVPVDVFAMARYTLPAGAIITVELSADATTWSAPVVLDVARAVAVHSFAGGATARYLRVAVVSATGGSIGWLWAGVPLATTYSASSCQRTRRWAVQRGGGYNPSALYAGAGDGWQIAWDPMGGGLGGHLLQADVESLLGVVDWAQQHDEPLVFMPHHAHTQDASLVRASTDAMDVTDVHEYQPNLAARRMLAATLALEPLYA